MSSSSVRFVVTLGAAIGWLSSGCLAGGSDSTGGAGGGGGFVGGGGDGGGGGSPFGGGGGSPFGGGGGSPFGGGGGSPFGGSGGSPFGGGGGSPFGGGGGHAGGGGGDVGGAGGQLGGAGGDIGGAGGHAGGAGGDIGGAGGAAGAAGGFGGDAGGAGGAGGGACEPDVEICDLSDNDCDGEVDEGFGTGEPCESGIGACVRVGEVACTPDGDSACDAGRPAPVDEVCNGNDDDCDGTVDEDIPDVGVGCNDGIGACAFAGETACDARGDLVCQGEAPPPGPEDCDGVDDDCNGVVDDVPGLGRVCEIGIGACLRAGRRVCGDAVIPVCDAVPGEPEGEVCDGEDNDCDGTADEDLDGCLNRCEVDGDCAAGESCREGVCVPNGDSCDGVVCPEGQLCRDGRCVGVVELGDLRGYGAHGGCDSWNACNDAFTCANAACRFYGHGPAVDFKEGLCEDLRAANGAFHCALFAEVPNNLDEGWGGGCNIPVAYEVTCLPAGPGCDAQNPCPQGEDCVGGQCVSAGPGCDAGRPCPPGQVCRAGQCVLGGGGPFEPVGSFRVNEGQNWSDPGVVSFTCREACAAIFGGDESEYGCSTVEGELNHRAFADGWGDDQFCRGEGVADDFKLPEDGPYDCGQPGCSYSAWVSDHGCAAVNYCWRGAAGEAEANPLCAENPLWRRVECQIGSWLWSSDSGQAQDVAAAEANQILYTGCVHSGDGNDAGLCSLDGAGWVSVGAWQMSGCDASWFHLGGEFTGQCGGHDGDTVRRLSTTDDGCYDYRPLPAPGPSIPPVR